MAKIFIIGGGVSGLSAGIYAQLNGYRAVICEKHFAAGGNLTGWDRGAYHIDNCIHWLTGTNPASRTYRMWRELGALGDGVEVFQGETLYTVEHAGQRLSLFADLRKTERDMLEISPRDSREIRSLVRGVEWVQRICGIAGAEHDEGMTLTGIVQLVPVLGKYYGLTAGELAARFSHPLLRKFIAAFWGDNFGSLALLMVFAHFCGQNGGIPRGSSCGMAERMTERFRSLGGEVLLGKEAVKVNLCGGKAESVTLGDGSVIPADYVVLTGDPAVMLGGVLDVPMPAWLRRQYENPKLMRFSSCQCAFAYAMEEPPFHGDFIFDIPEGETHCIPLKQVIVREFSHEKSFAPTGESVLQTMTFCYEKDAEALIALRRVDRAAYEAAKRELADCLAAHLVAQFPQMAGKLRCIDVWTPATYKRFTGSEMGSYMSFAMPSRMLPGRASGAIPGLSNVFLATQWQQIPGGLPIAAESGKQAVLTIMRREKRLGSRVGKKAYPDAAHGTTI